MNNGKDEKNICGVLFTCHMGTFSSFHISEKETEIKSQALFKLAGGRDANEIWYTLEGKRMGVSICFVCQVKVYFATDR